MAFTVQAGTWETDLFMFSFMSFWGLKYGYSLLYLNTMVWASNDSFLVPNADQLFQKLWSPGACLEPCRDGGCFTSKSRRSRFACGRGGRFREVPRQSFAIAFWQGEEEWDKAKADGMTPSPWLGTHPRVCERSMWVQRLCELVCTNQRHVHNQIFHL